MKNLLFLVHRIPYPPNKGDKIRSFNWLKHLSREYRVHLGCFIDDSDDLRHIPALQEFCAETHLVQLNPLLGRLRSLSGLLTGKPLTLPYYADSGLSAWVRERIEGGSIDAVLIYSGAMAQFLPEDIPGDVRTVCDFVDIDSDKWLQYSDHKPWPMNWVYRREARRMLAVERQVAWRTDAHLFVSAAEAKMFQTLAPEVADRTAHVENGVDTEYFDPGLDYSSPYPEGQINLVFTGAMDYWPNVDAVVWFATEVLPLIREQAADVHFFIVGARPAAQVVKLQALPGVQVIGAVKEMRPWLAHADVAVAPLRIARGIQNKVLEAMSMARPVVVTPEGLDGIDAKPGEQLELAANPDDFSAAVLRLLDPVRSAAMGADARALMQRRFAWQANWERLQCLLQGESLPIREDSSN